MNHARRFASVALDPRAYRAIREVRGRYRAALAALMGVVVVLSAFNLYTHSARIKSWLGFNAIGASMPSPADADARALPAAIDMGPPAPAMPAAEASTSAARASVKEKKRSGTRNAAGSRPANTAPAATASQPCDDVAAALGLCTRDKATVK